MPRAPRSPWFVQREIAECKYAFFVSHVMEDSAAVKELRTLVESQRPDLRFFLDVHNWPAGNDPSWAIRKHLLESQYLLSWITAAFLLNTRAWIWMEFAYAELLDLSQNTGLMDRESPFIVPVIHKVDINQLARTPLCKYLHQSLVNPGQEHSVPQIAEQLIAFYDRQARRLAPPTQP